MAISDLLIYCEIAFEKETPYKSSIISEIGPILMTSFFFGNKQLPF